MKRFFILFLTTILAFSLLACGEKGPSREEQINEEIRSTIQAEAAVECMFNYSNVKLAMATCTTIRDNGDGTYDVFGYVTVTDNYGDKYKGNFDAVVSVGENLEADCEEFNLETPKKQ